MEYDILTIRFKRNTRKIMEKKTISMHQLAKQLFSLKDAKNPIHQHSYLRRVRRLVNHGGRRGIYIEELCSIAAIVEVPPQDLLMEYADFDKKYIT